MSVPEPAATHEFVGWNRIEGYTGTRGVICGASHPDGFCGLPREHPVHQVGQLPVVKLVTCPACRHDFPVPLRGHRG